MDKMHSPITQKVKYMLSDLNDHHSMWEKYVEGREKDYIRMKIWWFQGLRNELVTKVGLDGEILFSKLICRADKSLEREDLVESIPKETNLERFRNRENCTRVTIIIHKNGNGESISLQEYEKHLKDIKSNLMNLSEIAEINE